MKDVGFISLVYVITFGSIVGLVAYTLSQGRKLSRQVPDKDKPWT
jgi:heme exporter protein D